MPWFLGLKDNFTFTLVQVIHLSFLMVVQLHFVMKVGIQFSDFIATYRTVFCVSRVPFWQ